VMGALTMTSYGLDLADLHSGGRSPASFVPSSVPPDQTNL
jgi:hypothetical protein